MKTISLVISCFNEEKNVPLVYDEVSKACFGLKDYSFEVLFVDDGSSDKTKESVLKIQEEDSRVKLVYLERNFGHEIAMSAGMNYASGDAVIFLDGDLEHPPALIPEMLKEWTSGKDAVLTKRLEHEGKPWPMRVLSRLFYFVFNKLSDIRLEHSSPDFRLLDRRLVDYLLKFNERERLFRGLLSWIGTSDYTVLEFTAPLRIHGVSKYNFISSMRLALLSIMQFSTKPLRIGIWLGLIGVIFAFLFAGVTAVEHYYFDRPKTGYATLVVLVTFMGSLNLCVMGIIAEYLGKIYLESKQRPLFLGRLIERK